MVNLGTRGMTETNTYIPGLEIIPARHVLCKKVIVRNLSYVINLSTCGKVDEELLRESGCP